jgi:hypothetical protein
MHPLRVGPPLGLYTLFVIAAVAAVLPFAHVLVIFTVSGT